MTNNCPCCSGKLYADCCQSIIENESAPTALALMRSRFTAYALGNIKYLINTIDKKNRSQHKYIDIETWSKNNQWTKLEIIDTYNGNADDDHGTVEFKAYYTDTNRLEHLHHEKSVFVKEDKAWYYVDGEMNPRSKTKNISISRNEPCPCGSGKKYKKCCL